jgi:hypothetical protein
MRDIEKHNVQLAGVLPKTYNLFTSTLLKADRGDRAICASRIFGDTTRS